MVHYPVSNGGMRDGTDFTWERPNDRRGLTTKIHALINANGLPTLLKSTSCHVADGRGATDMFDTLTKGDVMLGDRTYDSDALRAEMEARGVLANLMFIPQRVRKLPLAQALINCAMPSRGSLVKSNITEPSQRDTKNIPKIISHS